MVKKKAIPPTQLHIDKKYKSCVTQSFPPEYFLELTFPKFPHKRTHVSPWLWRPRYPVGGSNPSIPITLTLPGGNPNLINVFSQGVCEDTQALWVR